MKVRRRAIAAILVLAVLSAGGPVSRAAALSTAFTYQGQINQDGAPYTGTCDLQFDLFDAPSAGNLIAGPKIPTVLVTNGLFSVALDFHASPFGGADRWLQIGARCGSDTSFTALAPREQLTATPYSLYAQTAGDVACTGCVGSSDIASGAVTGPTIATGTVTGAKIAVATITGNKLALGTVTGANIASGQITGDKLAVGTVGAANIANGAVGTAQLASGSITGNKMSMPLIISGSTNGGVVSVINSGSGMGVAASVHGEYALFGSTANTGTTVEGVFGSSPNGSGVTGQSNTGAGITGLSTDGKGVRATSTNSDGVFAKTTNGYSGVYGESDKADAGAQGVYGIAYGAGGRGVVGISQSGLGVLGQSSGGVGILAHSDTGDIFQGWNGAPPGNVEVFWVTNTGRVVTTAVQITGGGDLAEKFQVQDRAGIEPGTLLVIDDQNPGKLKTSQQAYDTAVAGVVSGAGGVNPGMTLEQQGVMDGDVTVAIAGRIYVKAEALSAPIKPGDLLTSSSVAGSAMKASDRARAQGAIIGKAMSKLDSGTGLVLALVNLQ